MDLQGRGGVYIAGSARLTSFLSVCIGSRVVQFNHDIFCRSSVILLWCRILLVTSAAFFAFQGYAFAADQEAFVGFNAEYYYRTHYSGLKGPKAFAIGPQGAYGYSWGARSSKEAANSAIKSCSSWVAKQEKHGTFGKCGLLALDHKLLTKDPWIGSAWQKPAEGTDVPILKGAKSIYTEVYGGPALQGILLFVHGCNGPAWSRNAEIWGSFFNALGYNFFAPDSFAESRPAEVCGDAWQARAKDQTIILKLRVAQTLRSIAELKKKYPGLPVYVWGHSEGSVVVKHIAAEVSGIIASGDECDAGGLKIAAPASVPVLYLFGENDPNIEGSKLPLRDKDMQKCRKYVRNKKTKIVIVKNNKHEIWPWRPEVAKAMSEFIGAKPFGLAKSRPAEKFALTAKQTAEKALYQKNAGHKAFAARSNGAFSWATQWDFVEDAQQFTLYDCAHADNINVFKLSTHVCSVISVDGKDVTAP